MYGNLAEAALLGGVEAGYVIYAFAQTLRERPGRNGVPRRRLLEQLHTAGIFKSAAYVRMLLERGNGTFWSLGNDRVWLFGPKLVAWYLGARRANAHRHQINVAALRTRRSRRGSLLAAVLPVGKPIRQEKIRRLTSVSPRTQRRYRQAGHFIARRQDADVSAAIVGRTADARRLLARLERDNGVYVSGPDARLMKRIPNTYFPSGIRIPRGRRSKEMFAEQPLYAVAEGDRAVPRTFFDRTAQWVRCRRLKLGTDEAESYAWPYNVAYVRAGHDRWEAVAA